MSVFDVVELADNIFLCLGARELARAQRVCKQWHDIISRSHKMNQTLFLAPVKLTLSPEWKPPRRPVFLDGDSRKYTEYPFFRLSPALADLRLLPEESFSLRGYEYDLRGLLRWTPGQRGWAQTFFSQPPAQMVIFHLKEIRDCLRVSTGETWKRGRGDGDLPSLHVVDAIENKHGVTLGAVVASIRTHMIASGLGELPVDRPYYTIQVVGLGMTVRKASSVRVKFTAAGDGVPHSL